MRGVAAQRVEHRAEPRRRTIRPARAVCRLTIVINDKDYVVKPNTAEASAAIKAFRLSKPDGTDYDVAQTVHGFTCDCPDFIFHRDGIDPEGCKHIKAMVACGLLDTKGVTR